MRVGIIDYDMGNLHSVAKALAHLGVEGEIIREISAEYDGLILPGVGAFDPAMRHLHERHLVAPIRRWIEQNKPFLGICLGLQLLFSESAEGAAPGLGVIPGRVEPLQPTPGQPIPHMGWNQLRFTQPHCPLWRNLPPEAWVYFVHSYHGVPTDPQTIAATVAYGGQTVTAAIAQGNCLATQFHPEKSGTVGLTILRNWLTGCVSGLAVT
ncbi:MAG: imidazole glycerol phosphate synthase subunit HisH [Gloeomargarita sp. DG_2_bins_126]